MVGAAIWASSWAGICLVTVIMVSAFSNYSVINSLILITYGVAEISCWMWTGERQSTKMRIKYLESALNQDIQYFDTEVRTSDVVFAINSDAVMVQDAISEKVNHRLLRVLLLPLFNL